jgi:hypothetical protein
MGGDNVARFAVVLQRMDDGRHERDPSIVTAEGESARQIGPRRSVTCLARYLGFGMA